MRIGRYIFIPGAINVIIKKSKASYRISGNKWRSITDKVRVVHEIQFICI